MNDKFAKIREFALAKVFSDFDIKLGETIEEFILEVDTQNVTTRTTSTSSEQGNFANKSDINDAIEVVRGKYSNAFQNLFTTGFDLVFQKEFLGKIGVEEGINQKENDNDQMNLSITDEDLQNLEDANVTNAFYRKVFPEKCNLLLEKALKVQFEATNKLKTNVVDVECIEKNTGASSTEVNYSILELNKKSCSLLADIKENVERLHRLETAQKIILNNTK